MKRLFCVLVAVATIACAGHLSVKQTGTASLKTFDALLSHAQDVEKQNVTAFHLDVAAAPELVARCVPQRADGTPAPNPTKHQVIACFFRKAFTNEARAARALETYKPGDPVPTDLIALQGDVDAGIAAGKVLAPSATDFLSALQAVADEVLHVISSIQVALPRPSGA
jgi:hypothetical protein